MKSKKKPKKQNYQAMELSAREIYAGLDRNEYVSLYQKGCDVIDYDGDKEDICLFTMIHDDEEFDEFESDVFASVTNIKHFYIVDYLCGPVSLEHCKEGQMAFIGTPKKMSIRYNPNHQLKLMIRIDPKYTRSNKQIQKEQSQIIELLKMQEQLKSVFKQKGMNFNTIH